MPADPIFFASYARMDTGYPRNREHMKTFIDDLSAKVAEKIGGIAHEDLAFFDESSIETGSIWTNQLAAALKSVPVGLTIYSPSYFTSKWCGKEFQVFLDRASAKPAASNAPIGIVPVLWNKCTTLPPCVERIQYLNDAFPQEYKEVGLHQLLSLKIYSDQYILSVDAIADCVVAASANRNGLPPIPAIDFDKIPSAWDRSSAADPESHKEGSIAKTCFVFVSQSGWDWQPYPEKKIGAMAQKITGELGLRYEEIPCDAELPRKLKDTRANSVPTILFGDPDSLEDRTYAKPMRDYDELYLLNCGALIPWDKDARARGDSDPKWLNLTTVCHQKTVEPPPNHEWRSIFSQDELELKTRTIIENIRLRLLQQILSDDRAGTHSGTGNPPATNATILKAEDKGLTDRAAAEGIQVGSAPQLEGPSK
jgi:TIR domain